MIREAKNIDIPRLCELMEELHQKSRYSKYPLDLKGRFKPLCMESIRSGNGCLFVSEVDNQVEGFIIGMTDDLYHVLKVKYATDVFFYTSENDSRGALGLLNNYIEWAWSVPGVVEIRDGATNAVGDYERVAKLYARKGMTQEGVIYSMEKSHERHSQVN